ncbi:hypothetical protein DFP93_12519 [Aneurinibacillus soli]|uniref:Uncharacterized protein n=1 Tax=Aneurinibacillus soli TaxID=1500254 RepID=A0A0U5AVX2_9BACL|nr:hypothetical protein [Aneurinibacillus soli]PYE58173.1 hypothetical protein DFP93_12519 [Aneurinibacillus soli]BAU27889.1 hypothetical protein CB4_02063 [Aneurinibacillus soli]
MRGRKRSRQFTWIGVLMLLFVWSSWQVPVRAAFEPVELKVSVGFDGIFNWDSIVPITVTVKNVSDQAAEGDVVLHLQNSSQFDGTYINHVQLQKGESKRVTFRVHGQAVGQAVNQVRNSYVQWVQGDVSGVKYPIEGHGISGRGEHDRIVVVLGNDTDTKAILKAKPLPPKKDNAIPMELSTAAVPLEMMPTERILDTGIDVLMVTKETAARLPVSLQKEIDLWTKAGGQYLIVGSGSEATAWEAVVKRASQPAVGWTDPVGNFYRLSEAASKIRSLTLPDVPLAALLFTGYIVLIGPLVFYIMKKRNAREWNWLLIPVLALGVTGAVYMYGRWQHGDQVKMQSASLVNLLGNGDANVEQATTFFVPHGGDYTLSYPGQADVFAVGERNNTPRRPEEGNVIIGVQPDRKSVQFHQADFWSMHTVYAQQREAAAGTISGELEARNHQITGTIRNNTKYTLKDVRIASGKGVQEVAKLAPGEAIQVKLTAAAVGEDRPFLQTDAGKRLLPVHMRTEEQDMTRSPEVQLLEMAYNQSFNPDVAPDVYVLGWIEEPVLKPSMSAAHESTNLTLVNAKLTTVKQETMKGGIK